MFSIILFHPSDDVAGAKRSDYKTSPEACLSFVSLLYSLRAVRGAMFVSDIRVSGEL